MVAWSYFLLSLCFAINKSGVLSSRWLPSKGQGARSWNVVALGGVLGSAPLSAPRVRVTWGN
jgi:hypothetical protein